MQPSEGGQDSALDAIPIMSEKYSVSKKLQTQNFVVEKRWATKTVSVPVSVRYEEVYVNGKRFGSGLESALSSLKGTIKKEDERARLSRKKARLRGEQVPLYDSTMEEILPLFGEEIIVSKRMRQL